MFAPPVGTSALGRLLCFLISVTKDLQKVKVFDVTQLQFQTCQTICSIDDTINMQSLASLSTVPILEDCQVL